MTRQEFGNQRTECACKECSFPCRFMPGFLLPADIPRLYEVLRFSGESVQAWACRSLLASPGGTIAIQTSVPASDLVQMEVIRVPTLVPARKTDGSCIYLQTDGKCDIHGISPYGCAFFDSHMDNKTADARSAIGLLTVNAEYDDESAGKSLYARIWSLLWGLGYRSPDVAESKRKMLEAWQKEQGGGQETQNSSGGGLQGLRAGDAEPQAQSTPDCGGPTL